MKQMTKIVQLMVIACLVPIFGHAQIAISFDTLAVNHVSMEKLPPSLGAPFDCLLLSDVYFKYSFTLTNTTDSDLVLCYDGLRLGKIYFDGEYWLPSTFKYYWNRYEVTHSGEKPRVFPFDTLKLAPHEKIQLTKGENVSCYALEKVNSVEYVARLAPTVRLYVQLSGCPISFSEPYQHFKLGERTVDVEKLDCKQLGYQDRLVHNELLQEYLRENPGLFPSIFSDGSVQNYVLCTLKFANEQFKKLPIPDEDWLRSKYRW